ncbi:hypothetical protein SAMN05421771_2915 [Granulicella pectinivorans]|uniref:Dolichyl-phosphate-mannose-protein mannosyltransferase n=2 Tax=Granulicella pectinivorans TaxID=474950 RepID=A0A1I6ML72_9BACT|nr:hypothetical protein SAMN05421771_2915 [Granulicella pectinivorans]
MGTAILGSMKHTTYRFWILVCIVSGLFVAWLNVVFGRYGFDGYDSSPMIDAGWRVYSGQVPGRDFLVTFPPSLYLPTALLFRVFGVGWHSLVLGASIFYGLMTLLGIRLSSLVRKTHGDDAAIWTVLAFTAGQAILLLPGNTLWHATMAMDFAMYGLYAVYVLCAGGGRWLRGEAAAHLTIAIAALLLSKPNIAYPAILLCLLVAFRGGVGKRLVGVIATAGLALACLTLASVHVSFVSMLGTYAGLTGRLMPKAFLAGIFYDKNTSFALANLLVYLLIAPLMVAILFYAWRRWRSIWGSPVLLLGFGAIGIALIGMGTNFQFKLSDTPLLLLGVAMVVTEVRGAEGITRHRLLTVACGLYLLSVYFGGIRLAVQVTGGWAAEGCYKIWFDDPFLGRMKGCSIIPETLAEVDSARGANPQARVFFGPGMEFLYAGRRIQSPLHMPNWWHPGSSYPISKSGQMAEEWKKNHFDVLILAPMEDRAQIPPGILKTIDEEYVRVGQTSLTHVYARRDTGK